MASTKASAGSLSWHEPPPPCLESPPHARGGTHVAPRILDLIERSAGIRLEWIGSLRFEATEALFRKHADHRYSFTDRTSFVLMRELKVTDVLTTDHHIGEAGFRIL